VRQARQQRALAGVGQADEADVGDQLQFESQRALLAGAAGLSLARGWFVDVAKCALAAPAASAAATQTTSRRR